jgi:hypothetical protein
VKADRIGHPGVTSDPFNSANTATLTLEMPGERFELPEIAVSGSSVCGRSENAETAQLWEEIRKALSASQITSASQSVELSVRRFVRSRLPWWAAQEGQHDSHVHHPAESLRDRRPRFSPPVRLHPGLGE